MLSWQVANVFWRAKAGQEPVVPLPLSLCIVRLALRLLLPTDERDAHEHTTTLPLPSADNYYIGDLLRARADCAFGCGWHNYERHYCYRVTSTAVSGGTGVFPTSSPLPAVTTPRENTFVVNYQQLIIEVGDLNTEGRVVMLTHTNAAYALAAVIGDGVGTNQVLFGA